MGFESNFLNSFIETRDDLESGLKDSGDHRPKDHGGKGPRR